MSKWNTVNVTSTLKPTKNMARREHIERTGLLMALFSGNLRNERKIARAIELL